MSAIDKFREAVKALTPGNRYGHPINSAAALGWIALRDEEAVYDYIVEHAPDTTPNPAQVRDAIRYAKTMVLDGERRGRGAKYEPLKTEAEYREERRLKLPQWLRDRVQSLIALGEGMTSKDIVAMSPVPIPDDPVKQAQLQLQAIGWDWKFAVWAGNITDRKVNYGGGNGIIHPLELAAHIESGATIPTHISLNPMTGREGKTQGGRPSYDCDACIGSLRYALVEFDELVEDGLPSREQVALVGGLLRHSREFGGSLDPVSVVWTGGKSFHLVFRVAEHSLRAKDADEYEPLTAKDRKWYRAQTDELADAYASADEPRYRCDLQALKPSIHTRLAGAIRPETGRRARLLFVQPPEIF